MNRHQPIRAPRTALDSEPMPGEVVSYRYEDEEPGESSLDVRAVWATFYRNRWIIAVIIGLALLAGIASILLVAPKYTARASLQIDQQTTRVTGTEDQDLTQMGTEAERFLQTQVDVIRSRSLALRVAQSLGLNNNLAFLEAMGVRLGSTPLTANARTERVLDVLQGNLAVNLPRNSRVVEVFFTSRDPALAARVINSYTQNFIANNIQRRFSTSSYSRDFLENQLSQARTRLEASERAMNAYARAAQIVDPTASRATNDSTAQVSPTVASLMQLNQAYSAAQAERAQAQQRWEQASVTPVMNLPEVLSNQAISELTQQRATLTANLAVLRQRLTDTHPSLIQAAAQLADAQGQIDTLASSIRNSIRNQYLVSERQEAALRARVAALQSGLFAEQDRGIRYNILRREVDTNRQLYDSLLNRYKEVSASSGVIANNVIPVDIAEVPRFPTSPKPLVNLFLTLVAGIGFAFVVVFARERLDDSIRDPADVEAKLHVPLLGAVPVIAAGQTSMEALLEKRSPLAEAYHTIRSAIELSSSAGLASTLLITSSRKEEGKSTTTFALAHAFAQLGQRVLLIDADLRRPSQHKRIAGVVNKVGFANVLARLAHLHEVVQETPYENLFLMSSGPLPPDAAKLLSGASLSDVLTEAARTYDVVLLDGPPVMALADAVELASVVQATVFVVESGGAHFGQAKMAVQRLYRGNANIIGAVLTKFSAKNVGYGTDYYGYHYSAAID